MKIIIRVSGDLRMSDFISFFKVGGRVLFDGELFCYEDGFSGSSANWVSCNGERLAMRYGKVIQKQIAKKKQTHLTPENTREITP